jgi:hypothetical protein
MAHYLETQHTPFLKITTLTTAFANFSRSNHAWFTKANRTRKADVSWVII